MGSFFVAYVEGLSGAATGGSQGQNAGGEQAYAHARFCQRV